MGELSIVEECAHRMDKDGKIAQDSWFEFKGLGFDSVKYGDRISFFSSTITESSSDVSSVAPSAVEAAAESETETQASEVYRETEIQTEEETEEEETEFESETESQAAVATFGFSEEGDE